MSQPDVVRSPAPGPATRSWRLTGLPELAATGLVLLASGVSPLMFVGTAANFGSMHFFAIDALLPALFVVIVITGIARWRRWPLLRGIAIACVAGPLAGIGLDIVRAIGFRLFGAMPGSMPMLMGVLITNRFAIGPNVWSDLAGWGDHILVNGISFALVYVLLFGRPRWWWAIPYAWLIGTIFMVSPDMTMLGDIGPFGLAMGPGFAVTVYLAHTLYGLILGLVVARWGRLDAPIWRRHLVLRAGPQ